MNWIRDASAATADEAHHDDSGVNNCVAGRANAADATAIYFLITMVSLAFCAGEMWVARSRG